MRKQDTEEKPGSSVLRFLLVIFLLICQHSQADQSKTIVGPTEDVLVSESKLNFKARIDTGAQTSSIHAVQVKIDSSDDLVGKPISFSIVNEHEDSSRIETTVKSVITIKTSEGFEDRIKVPLTITWKNFTKTILVTLNDRSHMTHKLLLGRNWLRGDFIVDVEKNSGD